ncbi:UNVERIFIED_CONTAM: NAD(P)H-quinone oxidoreductase subunit U, chloroplastic [Sesamum angustifolium]|uniref:NAD(P)H-quinone oxidoreductase subunit U, chloroplastic n=1 Tax=Sesamum angustifolium TaxID=2727405 RepID=A0AAW2MH04_9LAMI
MATASSATGASTAYYIATQNRVSSRNHRLPTYYGAIKQRRRLLVIRNSSDESATATNAESAEIPAELPKGPPSLISALNVEKSLRGIAITDTDHYERLGLRTGCSYEQESHSILSSVEERRLYDWSLARSGKPDKYIVAF